MKYLLLFSSLMITAAAWSDTYDLSRRFGVGGGAGWTIPFTGNRFDDAADEDFVYNFHARYHYSAANAWQFNYARHEFEKTDVGAKVYDLMWINRFRPYDRFTPIFGLGAGVADFSNLGAYDTLKPALRARGGFEYALTDDLFASAVVDYQYINKVPGSEREDNSYLPGGEVHALAPQLNLTLFFGHDKQKDDDAPAATTPAQTASTTMAPATAMTGVPATTASGTTMMAAAGGASADDDADGVTNAKDKCPGTEQGREVNAYGCVPEEKANIQVQVLFAPGSAQVTEQSRPALEELAAFLNEHPNTKAEIQGHTDNTGNPARNKALSTARADAVRAYLVEKMQISPSRLTSYGYGDTQPVADNATPQGKTANRRVMAVISQ